jgi:uncharacterized membrane protein
MATAVLVTVALQLLTPRQGRVAGWWVLPILEVVMLVLLIAQDPGRIDRRSAALRRQTIVMIGLMTVGTLGAALILLVQILSSSEHSATPADLLGRGAVVWLTNVIVFSLWYWQLDGGGPAERAARPPGPESFAFPEHELASGPRAGWIPTYPDYLFLAFTNATAFSPTDTVPVRTWAKMTMMSQAAVSLSIAVVVVARAINLLPA